MILEPTINLMDIITAGLSFLTFIATVTFVVLLLRQLRQLREDTFYKHMMKVIWQLDENNLDIWGVTNGATITYEGEQVKVDIDKLRYLLCFFESYVAERGQIPTWWRQKRYKKGHPIYNVFSKNPLYRVYWREIIRDNFYVKGATFVKAVDNTIKMIEQG